MEINDEVSKHQPMWYACRKDIIIVFRNPPLYESELFSGQSFDVPHESQSPQITRVIFSLVHALQHIGGGVSYLSNGGTGREYALGLGGSYNRSGSLYSLPLCSSTMQYSLWLSVQCLRRLRICQWVWERKTHWGRVQPEDRVLPLWGRLRLWQPPKPREEKDDHPHSLESDYASPNNWRKWSNRTGQH